MEQAISRGIRLTDTFLGVRRSASSGAEHFDGDGLGLNNEFCLDFNHIKDTKSRPIPTSSPRAL